MPSEKPDEASIIFGAVVSMLARGRKNEAAFLVGAALHGAGADRDLYAEALHLANCVLNDDDDNEPTVAVPEQR